jgi:hypothetical protein
MSLPRWLCALSLCLLLPVPATAAATPRFSTPTYWTFADRVMTGVDTQWDAPRGAYVVGSLASTRENSMMLLTHAIAALLGHTGPTRQDARARILVDQLTRAPAWIGARGDPRGTLRSTCWSALLNHRRPEHRSLEPKVAEALAYAWRARFALGLSRAAIHRIVATIGACAHSAAWRYPAMVLDQINWNADMYAADATVSGDAKLLTSDYRRQLVRFATAIRRPMSGALTANLGTGYEFHYDPGRDSAARINLDSAEYANIVVDAVAPYERAVAAGMPPLPRRWLAPLRAWVLRLLAGSWTHAGYLNWDTGHGRARWQSAEYWAFATQGLVAIATSPRFWLWRAEGSWAKALFDRALLLARRIAAEHGTALAPDRMFGVRSEMENAEAFQPRILANTVRAIDLGLGGRPAQDPPPLYAFDPDTARLAVTTPWYSTAIVPDTRGAVPYGGIEPARLFGPDQTVAANVGGTPPDAFGIVVADAAGHERLASQHIRATLHVTRSPRGPLRHPLAYPARPYAGPFTELAARGVVERGGLTIVADHRFTPRAIRADWTVSCARRDCRRDTARAEFPTYGHAASIDVVATDGRRARLGGPGAVVGRSVPLAEVACVELRGSPSGGYDLIPLTKPVEGRLTAVSGVRQWTDPLAGPTLTIRLSPAAPWRTLRLHVRLLPVGGSAGGRTSACPAAAKLSPQPVQQRAAGEAPHLADAACGDLAALGQRDHRRLVDQQQRGRAGRVQHLRLGRRAEARVADHGAVAAQVDGDAPAHLVVAGQLAQRGEAGRRVGMDEALQQPADQVLLAGGHGGHRAVEPARLIGRQPDEERVALGLVGHGRYLCRYLYGRQGSVGRRCGPTSNHTWVEPSCTPQRCATRSTRCRPQPPSRVGSGFISIFARSPSPWSITSPCTRPSVPICSDSVMFRCGPNFTLLVTSSEMTSCRSSSTSGERIWSKTSSAARAWAGASSAGGNWKLNCMGARRSMGQGRSPARVARHPSG